MAAAKPFLRWVGLLVVLLLIWINPSSADYVNRQGVSPIISSKTASLPSYALHILFIGNSFTFFHDIPQQLADIATADPGNQTQFFIKSVTRGGIGLKELWEDNNAQKAIESDHWDYVVLQQQSSWAISEVEDTFNIVGKFDKLIKKAGAKTLLYLTWPDKPGSHWYTDNGRGAFRNPDYVLRKFFFQTHKLAEEIGAIPVDVGLYWSNMLVTYPEVDLYEPDAHHPNVAGSYLAALVFYKTLTDHDVSKINFKPPAVTADAAFKIKTIVSQPPQ